MSTCQNVKVSKLKRGTHSSQRESPLRPKDKGLINLFHIQILVNQDKILHFRQLTDSLFRLEAHHKQIHIALDGRLLAHIDEGRIKRFRAIRMQTIVRQILQLLHLLRFNAHIFQLTLVVSNRTGMDTQGATAT